jgi:hypothetical protein
MLPFIINARYGTILQMLFVQFSFNPGSGDSPFVALGCRYTPYYDKHLIKVIVMCDN